VRTVIEAISVALQNLMDYPALTTGLVTEPRGIGSMVAMFLALLINRVDNRLIILFGLLLTAVSMWQMRSRLSECFARAIARGPPAVLPPHLLAH
jgi:hypothetical protein